MIISAFGTVKTERHARLLPIVFHQLFLNIAIREQVVETTAWAFKAAIL